jgi:hypothetical protein
LRTGDFFSGKVESDIQMVMWNLVAHGVRLAVRGLEAFSRTEAGKKTAEVSSRAFEAAKEASKDALASYRQSRAARAAAAGASSSVGRWADGTTVVASDGRVGVVVRYLTVAEAGGPVSDTSTTTLVLLDLLQYTSELDRYLIANETSLRGL